MGVALSLHRSSRVSTDRFLNTSQDVRDSLDLLLQGIIDS